MSISKLCLIFNIAPSYREGIYKLIAIFGYVLFDIYINTNLYGSFENAMTRFYYRVPSDTNYLNFITIVNTLNICAILLFFLIRFSNTLFKLKSAYFYIALILLLLVTFPRGTRGAILFIILAPFLADLFVTILFKRKIFTLINLRNLILIFIGIFLILFLSASR